MPASNEPPSNPSSATQNSLFITLLPPEIRTRIYKEVLCTPATLSNAQTPSTNPLNLLAVSKSIYLETFHLYYRHFLPPFPSLALLRRFLTFTSAPRRLQITHLAFSWNAPLGQSRATFRLLKKCPNLSSLSINLHALHQLHNGDGRTALREVRGLKHVSFLVPPDYQDDDSPEWREDKENRVELTATMLLESGHEAMMPFLEDLVRGMRRERLKGGVRGEGKMVDVFERRRRGRWTRTDGEVLMESGTDEHVRMRSEYRAIHGWP